MTVVAPKDAATILVVRDGIDGVEVCMLRRSPRSDFVPGVHVFPGGAVETTDGAAAVAAWCRGLDDAEASRRLGLDSGGLGVWVAAVRECFEEAGLLLGADTVDAGELARLRVGLNSGAFAFADVCRELDLALPLDAVHYYSHWITPEGPPIRYDTRFFVCAAPSGQIPIHDGVETVGTTWITPRRALDDHAAGRFQLVPATKSQLESMLPFESAERFVGAAAALEEIPTIQPIIIPGENGEPGRVRIPFPDGPVELPLP